MTLDSPPNHVCSWSPAICQWGNIHTYIHTYIIIIMVLSNLSVSDVSIYFVWVLALLVVRDELEHLWRAISCCRLNRSPQVSHLNGSFARSATILLHIHTYIHTYIIIMRQDHQLPAQLGLHLVVSSSINKWQCHKYPTLQQRFQTKSMTYIHTYIHHHHHHASGSSAPCPIRASRRCVIHTYIHSHQV